MSEKLRQLIYECILETVNEMKPPANWNVGFQEPLRLKNGEVPFQINGKWYLYVYDTRIGDDVVYDYSTDMTIPYDDFQVNYAKQVVKFDPKVHSEGKTKKDDENTRRKAARRKAEVDAGFKMPRGGAIPSKKSKAKEKDKKRGRKPVKHD